MKFILILKLTQQLKTFYTALKHFKKSGADYIFAVGGGYNDACAPGNPRKASAEEIKNLYKSLM